jgi:hypothetical protein
MSPFRDVHPSLLVQNFTHLNNICRQLYVETAILPFKANVIAFESHNVMVNLVIHEKRLSRQQREAISILMLPNDVPGGNVLAYLPNVEQVYLAFDQPGKLRGLYKVVRGGGKRPRLEDPHGHLVREG